MKPGRIIGIVLIAVGVAGLALGGLSFSANDPKERWIDAW
jgi:hypothetical protein